MAKIIQQNKTITADFTYIENQYQNNTFDIEIELSDDTFKDYIVMLSVSNPQHTIESYPIPIIDGVAKLPYYCTDFLGTTTISLFGYKARENDVITTNKIDFEVIASNPTNIYTVPSDDNWHITMKNFAIGLVDALGKEIEPTIGENHHWFIGGEDTGVLAEGFTPTVSINPDNFHWIINGVETDIKADGMTTDYYTKSEVNDFFKITTVTFPATEERHTRINVPGMTQNSYPFIMPQFVKLDDPQTEDETNAAIQESWNNIEYIMTYEGYIDIKLIDGRSTYLTLQLIIKEY